MPPGVPAASHSRIIVVLRLARPGPVAHGRTMRHLLSVVSAVALAGAFAACGGGNGESGFDPNAGNDEGGANDDGGPTLGGDGSVGTHAITLSPSNATIFIDTA